jgi:ribosome biogenesis GTPase
MIKGKILKSTGSWYNVLLESGEMVSARIAGKLRLDDLKSTNPLAVGDVVQLQNTGTDYSVTSVEPRKNYVVRQSPRKKHNVHLLASNIDLALLIVTIVEPKVKTGFIDRFLLMTEPYEIPVTIVFNKYDLYSSEDVQLYRYFETVYTHIGYNVIPVSCVTHLNLDLLSSAIDNKTVLIAGQSGVGKSSIVNAVAPGLELRTNELSEYSGKGQHTTTFAEMHPLPNGGYIIDTPGIKTLAFNNLEILDVAHNFREFFSLSQDCKFSNCMHRNEPGCAVKKALEAGEISSDRYANYLQIIDEIEHQNYWEVHGDI